MISSKLAIKYEKEVNNTEYVFLGQNRINWVDSVRHLDNWRVQGENQRCQYFDIPN